MQHTSRSDLWKVAGYYINICLGHAFPYLRFCSYAHLRHLGYTVDDLYSCQDIVVVNGDSNSVYDPLILSVDIFQYVATDKTIALGSSADQKLILKVLRTIVSLQMSEKTQYVPIETVMDQFIDTSSIEQSALLRHIDTLVEHRWLQKNEWPSNTYIGISIPGHSEIIKNLQYAEDALRQRLLHDAVPFVIVPVSVRYAPLVKEYAFSSGGEHVQSLPINFQAVYGTEYHIASLLGNRSFTICSTERYTYIGLGDIFY